MNRLVAGPPRRVDVRLMEHDPPMWRYEYPGLEKPDFDLFRFLAVCWLWMELRRIQDDIAEHGPRWLVRHG